MFCFRKDLRFNLYNTTFYKITSQKQKKKCNKSCSINNNQGILLLMHCGIVHPLVPLGAYECQLDVFTSR